MTDLPEVHIDAIHRVVDDGLHNAFTDLCRYLDRVYLAFRCCPDGHFIWKAAAYKDRAYLFGWTGRRLSAPRRKSSSPPCPRAAPWPRRR